MAQRAWISVSKTDVAEWWLNPDYVTYIYRNNGAITYMIHMDDGSEWSVEMASDAGKALADMLKGNR